MITASDVKDFLKTKIVDVNNWYGGALKNSDEKGICVYSKPAMGKNLYAIGQKHSIKLNGFSILIHWNKNYKESEIKSAEVYEVLNNINSSIAGHRIIKTDFRTSNPVGVGVDENNIYEFVIYFDLHYER